MTDKRPIRKRVIAALVLAVLGALWLLLVRKTPPPETSRDQPSSNDTSLPLTQDSNKAKPEAKTAAVVPIPPKEKLRIAAEHKNVPINFWAKVVDQSDTPVPGVSVSTTVRHWGAIAEVVAASFPRYHTQSAADGTFEILNSSGDVLTLETLEKPGFSVPRQWLTDYGFNISSNISVDREHPLIIKIWRKIGDQSLLSGHIFYKAAPDGRRYSVNLVKKTIHEGTNELSDLWISLQRPGDVQVKDHYKWSFSMEAPTGGVVECEQATPFVAPLDGYAPSFTFHRSETDQDFSDSLQGKFFVKTRGGQNYALLKIEVYAFYDEKYAALSITYTANTNASPVLQN